jgi:hypothetical protein
MSEIALRLPIANFPEQISGFALHPDAMYRARFDLQGGQKAKRPKGQKDCRYEREIFP